MIWSTLSCWRVLQVNYLLIKHQCWTSLLVLSCASLHVWILDFHFCPPGTNWERGRWIIALFVPSSLIRPVFGNSEKTTDGTLMNLWMMHLSCTGRTAQNEVKYLFPIGPQEEGGGGACLTRTDWAFIVSTEPLRSYRAEHRERGKKIPSEKRETFCRMMNTFYNAAVLLHALEMWTFLKQRGVVILRPALPSGSTLTTRTFFFPFLHPHL